MKWWKKKDPKRYVIVKVAKHGGIAVAYFMLDNDKVWAWTRQEHKAKIFLCPDYAEKIVKQTSAEWEAKWEVRTITI